MLCLVCLCSLYFCSLPWVTKDTCLNNSSKKNRNEIKKAKIKPSMITLMTPAAACLRDPALPCLCGGGGGGGGVGMRSNSLAWMRLLRWCDWGGKEGREGRSPQQRNYSSKQRSPSEAEHQLAASQWNENENIEVTFVSSCESTGRVLYVTSKMVCSTSSVLGKIRKPSKHGEAQLNPVQPEMQIREMSNMTKLHLKTKQKTAHDQARENSNHVARMYKCKSDWTRAKPYKAYKSSLEYNWSEHLVVT